MTRAPFNVRRARIAVAHPNHALRDLSVERRRRYVEARWRPEAFGEPVRPEDTERYFRERGEVVQGGLF